MLKRTLLLLCVLALALSGTGAAAKVNWSVKGTEEGKEEALSGGAGAMLDEGGVYLEVTGVSFREGDTPILRFDVWVSNNTGRTVYLSFDNAYADGEEVDGIGIFGLEDGESTSEYFFFQALEGQSAEVLRNPRSLSFTLSVKDDATYETVVSRDYRLTDPLAAGSQEAREPQQAQSGDTGLLFDRNGVKLEVTGISFRDGELPQLRFDVWVTNDSGGTLNLSFDDVYVDGEEVNGIGIYDLASGQSIAEYFFFEPLEGQSADILRNPRAISFKVRVSFDSTGDDFFTQECGMTGPFSMAEEAAQPTVRPFSLSTVRPYSFSTPRPTAVPDYPWLEKGSEGSDVRRLQLALISLGYLSGSADGVYGNQTAQAVYEFRAQNGLLTGTFDSEASPDVQAALFSGDAEPYSEPSFSLEINYDSNGQWENVSGDRLKMRVEVYNASKHRTVKAFEIYMYATDVWGERIYGEDQVYYDTTTKNVGPGKTVYSDYMVIPDRSQIDKVYIGISKVVYTDGSVEEPSGGVNYWNWEIW